MIKTVSTRKIIRFLHLTNTIMMRDEKNNLNFVVSVNINIMFSNYLKNITQ